MSLIEIQGVSKTYQTAEKTITALGDINLSIERGSFVCIIGGSGCGKSTLLNIIAGFERPSAGQVLIDGREVRKPSKNRQMIFQSYGLFPWRTVAGNVRFSVENDKNIDRTDIDRRVHDSLATVGLESFADAFPHQLSGGMKQRVAVARALAAEPDIVFMDEPFGALDAITKMKLQDEVRKICDNGTRTVIMITHDIDEAIYLSDRILVMKPNPGRIFQDINVKIGFPRQRTSADFVHLRSKLLQYLDLAINIAPEYSI